jgi:hypothetical protein
MSLTDRITDLTDPALTRRGQLSVLYYAMRRMFVAPAEDHRRCFMGAPIGDHVRCPRQCTPGGLWCRRHADRPVSKRGTHHG